MTWRITYEEELEHVFQEAERLISHYPTPLNDNGLAYLKSFNPLLKESSKNHICYLLPFWMKPLSNLETQQTRMLSLANVFVMLYFFIQDDLMDEPTARWKEQLALGNLFQLTMLDCYRSMFDHNSVFWQHYKTYVTNWSLAVAYENPMGSLIPVVLAQKAAPVKLASTGALLLAGRQDMQAIVSAAVDLTLGTLQLADDWADWEEDYELGNANSLIGLIHTLDAVAENRQSKTAISNAIYIHGAMDRFARLAQDFKDQLHDLKVALPDLIAFQEELTTSLHAEAKRLARTKQQALQGGFIHFLSQNPTLTANHSPSK